MDSAIMLINSLKSKNRGQISRDCETNRRDMLMQYLRLSPKDVILVYNENAMGPPLEIPETLSNSPAFSNAERHRYAAWRNTTHGLYWAPLCNVDQPSTRQPSLQPVLRPTALSYPSVSPFLPL